ncbi:MAG: bifunctional riboflavin kinase/FAD synthetase [Gemmobacter sp.]
MQTHRNWHDLPPAARGASAAMGNFDGVHLGHRHVLDLARRPGAPLGVVTFEPHPREVFAPDAAPFRLTDSAARARHLGALGVGHLYELPFDRALAGLSPADFVAEVLDRGLGLRHVVVGADFRFGRGRAGGAEDLRALSAARGIGTTIAEMVADADAGARVSSSAIRAALAEGRPADAARMLGRWHEIEGIVEQGDRRGRELGYPTANIVPRGLHLPRFGIYAVTVEVLDGPHRGRYGGAANVGVRPMFGGTQPNLETFLFDFSGDLYGARIAVGFVAFLRPEAVFDGLGALIAQMDADCAAARAILASA